METAKGMNNGKIIENDTSEGLVTIKKSDTLPLIYSVDDKPSWTLSCLLGVQVSLLLFNFRGVILFLHLEKVDFYFERMFTSFQ